MGNVAGKEKGQSLPSLLQSCLLGDKKSRASIMHFELHDEPANAVGPMENVAQNLQSALGDLIDYLVIAADQPLRARLARLARRGPSDGRPDYKVVIPINGQLHNAQAMQNVIKRLLAGAGLREQALAKRSGMSDKNVANLDGLTHFKKNHRFLRQCLAALVLRAESTLKSSPERASRGSASEETLMKEGEAARNEAELRMRDRRA